MTEERLIKCGGEVIDLAMSNAKAGGPYMTPLCLLLCIAKSKT
jgi:hypothetical protein